MSPQETCSITASLGTWSSCCRTHRREMAQSKPIMPMAKGKKNSRALQFETAKFNQDLKVFGIFFCKIFCFCISSSAELGELWNSCDVLGFCGCRRGK